MLDQVRQLGLARISRVWVSTLYFLKGELSPSQVRQLSESLLVDPIVEDFRYGLVEHRESESHERVVEVGFHPGVTDAVAENLLRRAHQMGIYSLEAAATGTRYRFEGNITPEDLRQIACQLLANEVIQYFTLGPLEPAFVPTAQPSAEVDVIPIRDADDQQLQRISQERVLSLSLAEMRVIREEFRRLGRDPTDVELETLAQTWSEHCQHKTFKTTIRYVARGGIPRHLPSGMRPSEGEELITGLLRSYIQAATEQLARPWVRSAFVDNAGVIALDGGWEVSFKVETHNHPSALEPFGGANTGVGGVIRDIIGVSARPIAVTDILCFGPPDLPAAEVPPGTLHPARVARGVIAGIEDYGNKMGIPTVSGAILYDPGYTSKPPRLLRLRGAGPPGPASAESPAR